MEEIVDQFRLVNGEQHVDNDDEQLGQRDSAGLVCCRDQRTQPGVRSKWPGPATGRNNNIVFDGVSRHRTGYGLPPASGDGHHDGPVLRK